MHRVYGLDRTLFVGLHKGMEIAAFVGVVVVAQFLDSLCDALGVDGLVVVF